MANNVIVQMSLTANGCDNIVNDPAFRTLHPLNGDALNRTARTPHIHAMYGRLQGDPATNFVQGVDAQGVVANVDYDFVRRCVPFLAHATMDDLLAMDTVPPNGDVGTEIYCFHASRSPAHAHLVPTARQMAAGPTRRRNFRIYHDEVVNAYAAANPPVVPPAAIPPVAIPPVAIPPVAIPPVAQPAAPVVDTDTGNFYYILSILVAFMCVPALVCVGQTFYEMHIGSVVFGDYQVSTNLAHPAMTALEFIGLNVTSAWMWSFVENNTNIIPDREPIVDNINSTFALFDHAYDETTCFVPTPCGILNDTESDLDVAFIDESTESFYFPEGIMEGLSPDSAMCLDPVQWSVHFPMSKSVDISRDTVPSNTYINSSGTNKSSSFIDTQRILHNEHELPTTSSYYNKSMSNSSFTTPDLIVSVHDVMDSVSCCSGQEPTVMPTFDFGENFVSLDEAVAKLAHRWNPILSIATNSPVSTPAFFWNTSKAVEFERLRYTSDETIKAPGIAPTLSPMRSGVIGDNSLEVIGPLSWTGYHLLSPTAAPYASPRHIDTTPAKNNSKDMVPLFCDLQQEEPIVSDGFEEVLDLDVVQLASPLQIEYYDCKIDSTDNDAGHEEWHPAYDRNLFVLEHPIIIYFDVARFSANVSTCLPFCGGHTMVSLPYVLYPYTSNSKQRMHLTISFAESFLLSFVFVIVVICIEKDQKRREQAELHQVFQELFQALRLERRKQRWRRFFRVLVDRFREEELRRDWEKFHERNAQEDRWNALADINVSLHSDEFYTERRESEHVVIQLPTSPVRPPPARDVEAWLDKRDPPPTIPDNHYEKWPPWEPWEYRGWIYVAGQRKVVRTKIWRAELLQQREAELLLY